MLHVRGQALAEVRGTMVLAQENRFRIETEDGRSVLFVLGKGSGPSLGTIASWAKAGQIVVVRYKGKLVAAPVAEQVHPV